MNKKCYLNLSYSIQIIVIFLIFLIVTVLYLVFNKVSNETGFIVGVLVLCLFDCFGIIGIIFFCFHNVVIEKDFLVYNKIFTKTKMEFLKITNVYVIKKATINSLVFRIVQFEEVLVLCDDMKRIELPLSMFEYDDVRKRVILKD